MDSKEKKEKIETKETPKKAHNINYLKEKGNEKVRGVFKFYEQPGQTVTFPFKYYPHEPVTVYSLTDGKECEIPLVVAQYINNNCKHPVHAYRETDNGDAVEVVVKGYVQRMEFVSTEIFDVPIIQRPGI